MMLIFHNCESEGRKSQIPVKEILKYRVIKSRIILRYVATVTLELKFHAAVSLPSTRTVFVQEAHGQPSTLNTIFL
jgi:hypothetical protein